MQPLLLVGIEGITRLMDGAKLCYCISDDLVGLPELNTPPHEEMA